MAIRERGAAFQADARVDGKRQRRDFNTRQEAEEWVAKQAAVVPPPKVQPTAPTANFYSDSPATAKASKKGQMRTIGEAFDRTFARYYVGTAYEPKLIQQANRILTFWGNERDLQSIDQDAMDDLIAYLRGMGLSGATVNRYLAVVSKVLTFAAARVPIVRPKIEREREGTGRVRWMTGEEEQLLLQVVRQWGKDNHADVIIFLLDTGMRSSEVWALDARDVNVETGAIHIWQNKTDHPRTIYMTPRVKVIILRRLEAVPIGRVFPYEKFWLRPVWDRARAHLGHADDAQYIPYMCRHTCASRMVQRGVALPIIMRWLGHKSIQMTMRYAHLAPTNLQDAADILAMPE